MAMRIEDIQPGQLLILFLPRKTSRRFPTITSAKVLRVDLAGNQVLVDTGSHRSWISSEVIAGISEEPKGERHG